MAQGQQQRGRAPVYTTKIEFRIIHAELTRTNRYLMGKSRRSESLKN